MKHKAKYSRTKLIGCILVLAFVACAGCTGTDPFVGTYVHSYTDGDWIYDIHSDGTYHSYYALKDGNMDVSGPKEWKKTGDNRYESGKIIFSLSSDGYTMYTRFEGTITDFERLSTYKIPTPSHQ